MMNDVEKQNNLIQGKVAGILNERELAINIGTNNGVIEGMKFKVLTEKPTEIRDPETDKFLGIVDREKVRVQVIEVQEKLSICRTYRTYKVGGGAFGNLGIFNRLFEQPHKIPETLKADESEYPQPLSEEESYVKKGDRVIQLIENNQ